MKFQGALVLAFLRECAAFVHRRRFALPSGAHLTTRRRASVAEETVTLPPLIQELWGIEPDIRSFPGANFPIGTPLNKPDSPPILELPNFLSHEECRIIRDWAKFAIENGAEECNEYLNYRVNQEIDRSGETSEGKALIEECSLQQTQLSATNKGGFRVRLDPSIVEGMLKSRLLRVLGKSQDVDFVFEEGAWIRPTPFTVVIRDMTVVFYGPNDGVPPHVDGKDGTLLVYLASVPKGVGGRTVFPEDDFSQLPVEGTALLYRSKTELLHFSEAMTSSHEKWIMQLLIDYKHDYRPGDTVTCFRTGTCYVWDGS